MKMNSSSWFPVKTLTKSACHFDWMMGATKFPRVKDFLNPMKVITKFETIFWNRTLNASISLSTYEEAKRNPVLGKKCLELGLPLDIRV